MKKLLLLIMLVSVSMHVVAQEGGGNPEKQKDWELFLRGGYLTLEAYGKYQDGVEVNRFVPSKEHNNEYEAIYIADKEHRILWWLSSSDGTLQYNYRINGQYLILTNKRVLEKADDSAPVSMEDTWLKMERTWVLSDTRYFFLTSKEGTYLYFSGAVMDTIEQSGDVDLNQIAGKWVTVSHEMSFPDEPDRPSETKSVDSESINYHEYIITSDGKITEGGYAKKKKNGKVKRNSWTTVTYFIRLVGNEVELKLKDGTWVKAHRTISIIGNNTIQFTTELVSKWTGKSAFVVETLIRE